MSSSKKGLFSNLRYDILSSSVVFLVALPLCLGIALASGASPLSGLVAGIIGGIVIGSISKSPLSVSGPAAGLIVIVLSAIEDLGSFEVFLVAVFLSGLIQIVFGLLKGGLVSMYFPSAVIRGMLAAIGLTLILKQIPHLLGVDADAFGEMEFLQRDGNTTLSFLNYALNHITEGCMIIGVISILVLIFWDKWITKKIPVTKLVPGSFVVVLLALGINLILQRYLPNFAVFGEHLVTLPKMNNFNEVRDQLTFPDFSALGNFKVYVVALTLAVVASLESLLSLEAVEKLDPEKRRTSSNRELVAQGVGNSLSGLIGGLPITAVIVRSSANLTAGAKSKLSAILHGVFLLVAVLLIPTVLNLIPLAALAAVLIMIGYKLSKPSLFIQQYKLGLTQFAPFVITFVAIFCSDLLIGIIIGLLSGAFFILVENHRVPYFYIEEPGTNGNGRRRIVLRLSEHVSFLNKASLQKTLEELPVGTEIVIDGTQAKVIDHDALEVIHLFAQTAPDYDIECELINIPSMPDHIEMH